MIGRLMRSVRRRDGTPAPPAAPPQAPAPALPPGGSELLAEINAEVPAGVDWRAGALRYVAAEFEKHGTEAVTRYLLSKPFAPVAPGTGSSPAE